MWYSLSVLILTLFFKIIKILYFVVEPATSRTLGYLCPDLVRKNKIQRYDFTKLMVPVLAQSCIKDICCSIYGMLTIPSRTTEQMQL